MKGTKAVVLAAVVAVLGSLSTQAQTLFRASINLTCTTTNSDGTKFETSKITTKDILDKCASANGIDTSHLFLVFNSDDVQIQVWQITITRSGSVITTNAVQECAIMDFSGGNEIDAFTSKTQGNVTTETSPFVGRNDITGIADSGNLLTVTFSGSDYFKGTFVDKFNSSTSKDVQTQAEQDQLQATMTNADGQDFACKGILLVTGKGFVVP